jgi:hypothetical protein
MLACHCRDDARQSFLAGNTFEPEFVKLLDQRLSSLADKASVPVKIKIRVRRAEGSTGTGSPLRIAPGRP